MALQRFLTGFLFFSQNTSPQIKFLTKRDCLFEGNDRGGEKTHFSLYLSNLGHEFSFLFKESMETHWLQSLKLKLTISLMFQVLYVFFFF